MPLGMLAAANVRIVAGQLNELAHCETFTIELFANVEGDPSGFGEGQFFLGSVTVTTDDNGFATFTATFSLTAGQFITATATDPNKNTSEFSAYI
jgi:hypothetical protein